MKTNKFNKLFNTIMESEGYDSADELEPFEGDYVPTDELIRKEAMAQLRYEDIPYSEAKMLANDIVAALCGQPFDSKSDLELYVSFEIRENLRAFYESKKVDTSKKVIKEDSNPDVQDQADILNAYIEATDDEIDWEYAGDYELDIDLNTCLFYNDKDADDTWPIGDFATNEWDEEEDDYVYRDSEEVFRDAYEYKFDYGSLFYVADELMDMVKKYGEGNPVFDEVKNIVEADPDIVYEDYDCEDENYVNLVHKMIDGLKTVKSNMSDLDTVKFDVLCNLVNYK